jgi:hypothetical protein
MSGTRSDRFGYTRHGTVGSAPPRTPGRATRLCTGFAQNQLWCEVVALACELLAWMQMLAFIGPARCWEPRRLRLRNFAVAGHLVRGQPDHHRGQLPSGSGTRLTTSNSHHDQEEPAGPVEPRPTRATAGRQARPGAENGQPVATSGHQATIAESRG